MWQERLSIAQCLLRHPILKDKLRYKVKYLNILEYFTNLCSKEDEFAQSMLKTYKMKMLGDMSLYSYDEKEIKKAFKGATRYRLKGFKLFTYRYHLLFDCFFINSFYDSEKAKKITDTIRTLFSPRYFKRIELLYEALYHGGEYEAFTGLDEQIMCWKQNKRFLSRPLKKILITANMSAGKSTLINAIVGKKVNKTQNEACTAKVHYIYNKPFEDTMSYEWDYELNLDADYSDLMDDHVLNTSSDICVGTYFRLESESKNRICLIDTPGVNSSEHTSHKSVTEKVIAESDYDALVYVMNAENSGTIDDSKHLAFVLEHVKDKPVIFVVNKLDTFRKDEEAASEIISGVKKELTDMGFVNPVICPISARAAILAKKAIWDEFADEYEQIEYAISRKRFSDESYDLSCYGDEIKPALDLSNKKDQAIDLLIRSGFMNFEQLLIK